MASSGQFDWMSWAADWHTTQTECWLTTCVTYECPRVGSVEIQAIMGGTESRMTVDDMAIDINVHRRDFIIPDHQKLLIVGEVHEPQVGDEIHWIDTTVTPNVEYIYEVRSQGDEPVWDEYDRYANGIRIHTILIRQC